MDRRLRPRCCQPWSSFKRTSFRVAIYAGTLCANMMSWIFNTPTAAHSRPRPRRPKSVSTLPRNGYSYTPFIAKSKSACGLCFHQLGGHVELPSMTSSINRKYITYGDAVTGGPSYGHKLHARKKLIKIGRAVSEICSRTDKQTNSYRHTHRQTRSSQYSAPLSGAK